MAILRHSVGRGGINHRSDVRLVQELLNRHLARGVPLLKLDGIVGPKTALAIRHFQIAVAHMRDADGRIDPGGPTWGVLTAPPHVAQTTVAHRSTGAATSLPTAPSAKPGSPSAPGRSPASVAQAPSAPAASATPADRHDVIAWGAKVSPGFKRKVLEITARLEISADLLMSCMAFESGESFSPSIRNAAGSGAVGLIQFMPSTAKALQTSAADLAAMTAERQLDYVERYFRPYKGRIRTIEDIYMTILYPRAIGKDADFVLFTKGTKAYSQNKGLDADTDGQVSKYEAAAAVRAKYRKGLRPGYIG
jgi:hypothetical protein